jgi:hypothetical protein
MNDEVFMENLRKSSKARALEQLSQNGSYAQTGTYSSLKNNTLMAYDSSYELKAMEIFENDPTINSYGRCKIGIPYLLNGDIHQYFPDFIVNYIAGQKMIEVKPAKFVNSPKNLAKFAAAREYCGQNNIEFEVWTKKDLNLKK